MAARFVKITRADFEALMTECGFHEVGLEGTYERVYERERSIGYSVRVYSSIVSFREGNHVAEKARSVGADAIRVVLVFQDRIVWTATRAHRTQGWRDKTRQRMREAWAAFKTIQMCPRCGRPMVERRRRTDDAPFLGCISYPQCRGTRTADKFAWPAPKGSDLGATASNVIPIRRKR